MARIAEYCDMPLDDRAGGGGTYVKSVTRELESMGHEVVIIDGSNRPRLFANHHLIPICKDADIHHFHEPSTTFVLSFLQDFRDLNRVITFHAPVSQRFLRKFYVPIIRYSYRKTRLVLTATRRNAELLQNIGVRSCVIPLWADEFFKPATHGCYLRKPYVLSTCVVDNFHKYKNYPMISKLGRILRKKFGIELLHAGFNDFSLPYVTHLGVVDRNQLRELYQNALALILPSKAPYEGFGLVAAEALACGTPVLASDGCGISEFLSDPFVSSLDEFEARFCVLIAELLFSPKRLISEAFRQSLKFGYGNCRKTANLIAHCCELK